MKIRCYKYTILLSCFLFLSACGFHLRGYQSLPPQLKLITIQAPNLYDPLVLQLEQNLVASGVTIAKPPVTAPVTLRILGILFNQQTVNISANTFVKTYNLRYRISFELENIEGNVIYGPKTVTTAASYVANDTQILGDNNLLNMQKENMRRQAISQILNRLNSLEAREALGQQ